MSLKNCLSFELAKETYKLLPNGFQDSKQKDLPKVAKDLGFDKLNLYSAIVPDFSEPKDLSNTLFIKIPCFPASVFQRYFGNHTERNLIKNWVSLGVEIAGMNLSDTDLESVLICGSPSSKLQAMGVCIDNSKLTNTVFAFANLRGLSSVNTEFTDVLIRNCKIEWAYFKDYKIGSESEFGICYDDNDSFSREVSSSVFDCKDPQPSEIITHGYTFCISNTKFSDCQFSGFFEPTHLNKVEFFKSNFGTKDNQCTIQNASSSKQINDWNIASSNFNNCRFYKLKDKFIIKDCSCTKLEFDSCSEIQKLELGFPEESIAEDSIAITSSNISSLIIKAIPQKTPPRITFSSSKVSNFSVETLSAKNGSKSNDDIGISISFQNADNISCDSDMTTLQNPTLKGVQFKGDLSQVIIKVNSNGSKLENCTFESTASDKCVCSSFLDICDSASLFLKNVDFLGASNKSPLMVKNVDFSRCVWDTVSFKNCRLENCTYPENHSEPSSVSGNSETRATFEYCQFVSAKIENADFSRCVFNDHEFLFDDEGLKDVDIVECSFSNSEFNRYAFTHLKLKDCDFESCIFDSANEEYLFSNCELFNCKGLVLTGNLFHSTIQCDIKNKDVELYHVKLLLDSTFVNIKENSSEQNSSKDEGCENTTKFTFINVACKDTTLFIINDNTTNPIFTCTDSTFSNTHFLASMRDNIPHISCYFKHCSINSESVFKHLSFNNNAFCNNSILEGNVIFRLCSLSNRVFTNSVINSILFESISLPDSKINFTRCILYHSKLTFKDFREESKTVSLGFNSCFYEAPSKSDRCLSSLISKDSPFIIDVTGGGNSPEWSFDNPDDGYGGFKLSVSNLFILDKSLRDWQIENQVFNGHPRDTLYNLWIDTSDKGLNKLAHGEFFNILPIHLKDHARNTRHIDYLTGLKDCENLKYLLQPSFIGDINSLITELQRESLKLNEIKKCIDGLATATVLRLFAGNNKSPLEVRHWLNECNFWFEENDTKNDMSELTPRCSKLYDCKYYGDFLLLREWIKGPLTINIRDYHDDYRSSHVYQYLGYIVLALGSSKASSRRSNQGTFLSMSPHEVQEEFKSWNEINILKEFADLWIQDNDEKCLSIVTDTKDGRFEFAYKSKPKAWIFKEYNQETSDCPWTDGICYCIPVYSNRKVT